MPEEPEDNNSSANSLIDKLRDFAVTLDAEERQLLAALLAPGVSAAWAEPTEVSGFSAEWSADQLPSHLSDAIRGRALRVEGW